ncbi:DUF4270 family protein [Maribellus sediminis]|uniref:DUF4270 family protein n=1 Tax=Maribellus sediminis TaxID=2696285 RepID=UPI00142FA578|nr:DUF4270 family protein [Maribellus sediminis]
MKHNTNRIFKYAGVLFLMALLFSACNKENDLGIEILPGTDLINVHNAVIKDQLGAYANSEFGIVTNRSGYNLIGSLQDEAFGNTTVNFATQLRITTYTDFGANPVADSTFLFLYYRNVYGDTLTAQNLKVYELEEMLYDDQKYTQDIDLKSMASDQVIGEIVYTPKVELDSASQDTLYQVIKIPIDNEFGQKLISADSADMVIIDSFLTNICKGIYIESEKVNTPGSGALMRLEASSSSTFQGSALLVYYNNDSNIVAEEPDTLSKAFLITQFSARVNNIVHDYTSTAFVNDLDQGVEQEDYIYIQPTGGLKSHITVGELTGWRDSLNTAINKAELVFQIDTIASDIEKYPPPTSLTLTFIDKDSIERLPIDYYFSPSYYGGYLREDYTYHFNVTQHVQRVINILDPDDDAYVGNQGFVITTGQTSDNPRRVILEGTGRETGVQLIITYSKYLQ